MLKSLAGLAAGLAVADRGADPAWAAKRDPRWEKAIQRGLEWVARTQSPIRGNWTAGNYPTAMTALAGTALVGSGSTTVQGPYAKNIRRAVDFLLSKSRTNGLIGDPQTDNRYTYGHGFSMLFLSQVLGEEQDEETRQLLVENLTRAVDFSCQAQTSAGGWGYVSAKDGSDFDEGSTTITQVQGLRGCRNAGIPVASEAIDKAKKYIYDCKNEDGGISYSSRNRGSSRPAITAAALAALYNAGDYDSRHVPEMLDYCKKTLSNIADQTHAYGHWHYTYLYYAQVMYRQGPSDWLPFRDRLYDKIVSEQDAEGVWTGNIGPIYVTACYLFLLRLDRAILQIYQRSAPSAQVLFIDGDDGQAVLVGRADHLVLVQDDRLAGLDGQRTGPGFGQRLNRAHADGGDVETHVLLRLGDLDHREPAGWTQLSRAANAFVRPLDGLDRQHRLAFDRHTLAHIDTAQLLGQSPAELDVLPLCRRGRAFGQISLGHEQLRGIIGGGGKVDAFLGERGHDRAQQGVVGAVFRLGNPVRIEGQQELPVGQVLQPVVLAEDQRLVEFPRHRGLRHAVAVEVTDGRPQLGDPLRLPVVAQLPQGGVGMILDRQAIDAVALRPQRLGDDDRVSSPACQQADLGWTAAAHAASCRGLAAAVCSSWATVCCSVRNCFFSSGSFCNEARITICCRSGVAGMPT